MSYQFKMVTCGTHDNIEDTELCIPITNKNLFDYKKIRPYIASHSKSVFFIIVLLHLFGQTIDTLLIQIGNQDNIIGIFVCVNQIYDLANNQTNVFHLSKRFLTCKPILDAIHSYEFAMRKFYQTSYQGLAYILKQTSNNLKQCLTNSYKVKVCDVLLIPLNTTDANLIDVQQRIIELCTGLCHDYEPRVCTIYDYISSDESGANMSEEDRAFMKRQNEVICSLVKSIAPIRIYVVGNENCISNGWSKLMIENEPDNGGQNTLQYDQLCTFLENEPVNPESIHNLLHRYGSSWKVTNTIPRILDAIKDDSAHFLTALDRSHITLEAREMIANVELSLWVMNYQKNSTAYNSEFQAIEEPRNVPVFTIDEPRNIPVFDNEEARNVAVQPDEIIIGEINNRILFYRIDSSNGDNNR